MMQVKSNVFRWIIPLLVFILASLPECSTNENGEPGLVGANDQYLSRHDINNDGISGRDELPPPLPPPPMLDKNGDGVISRDEASMIPLMDEQLFERLDDDGSGMDQEVTPEMIDACAVLGQTVHCPCERMRIKEK